MILCRINERLKIFYAMDINDLSFQMRALTKHSVRIKRISELKPKLQRMIADDSKKLQIITDFDHTLSKSHCDDGVKGLSTHGIFQKEIEKLTELNKKYFPIEHDEKLTNEEKIPFMVEWWDVAHREIVSAGYTRERLEKLVSETYHLQLRDGVIEFFNLLETVDVPIILFSAGIGDLIEIFLKQQLGRIPKNVHIISNLMIYNCKDVVVGFSSPLIHTFNKNSSVIMGEKNFFHALQDRTNVILIGDTIGDLNMDVGVEVEQNVIKIGFLNHSVDNLLKDYQEGYDIVCVQDQTFDIPLGIIKEICNKN